jgi:hypothetical protein
MTPKNEKPKRVFLSRPPSTFSPTRHAESRISVLLGNAINIFTEIGPKLFSLRSSKKGIVKQYYCKNYLKSVLERFDEPIQKLVKPYRARKYENVRCVRSRTYDHDSREEVIPTPWEDYS